MDSPWTMPYRLLEAGAGNLAAYLAAHVLLCLLPAFFMALLAILLARVDASHSQTPQGA